MKMENINVIEAEELWISSPVYPITSVRIPAAYSIKLHIGSSLVLLVAVNDTKKGSFRQTLSRIARGTQESMVLHLTRYD